MHGNLLKLRDLFADRRGAISVLAAFVLVGVIGVSALALEYGHGLLQKTENQRVADLAAFAGALVYGATGSSTDATSAATNVAALNGFSSGVSSSVVSSPIANDANSDVNVTVKTSVPLLLARVLTTNTTLPVSATAYAEVKTDAPGCIIALSGSGTGVTVNGSAKVSAPGCAVASNATVTANACTNTIKTEAVDYNSRTPSATCAFETSAGGTPPMNKALTTDPLSPSSGSPGSTEVTNATGRLSSVGSIIPPSAPSVSSGTAVSFGWSPSTMSVGSPACPATLSGSTWTVTCSGSGPFTFGKISLGGGITVNFNTGGSSSAIYNFSGDIDGSSGSALSFGPGTYNIKGGIVAAGSLPMTFGAGTFSVGTTSSSTCPGAGYSICVGGSGSVTFGGPSKFILAGGVYQDSGLKSGPALSFGYGASTNIFSFGAANGDSLDDANSGVALFGDASGSNTTTCGSSSSTFCMAGGVTTTGGSCLVLPAAAEHDINGSINGEGGIVLGAGIYTVNGYAALGNSSGGNVGNCPTSGTTTGLTALDVTLVISGTSTITCDGSPNVASSAFCLGAGYGSSNCPSGTICVDLTAPTSSSTLGSSTAGLAVIGPQSSSSTAAAAFTSGATNTRVSGAFYFPNGPVTMNGGATLQDTADSGACLELIGSQITLSGGTAAGSTCSGLSGSSLGTTVTLVQ